MFDEVGIAVIEGQRDERAASRGSRPSHGLVQGDKVEAKRRDPPQRGVEERWLHFEQPVRSEAIRAEGAHVMKHQDRPLPAGQRSETLVQASRLEEGKAGRDDRLLQSIPLPARFT